MTNELVVIRHIPFSVIFPDFYFRAKLSLVRTFPVLQLRSVRLLLAACTEDFTRFAMTLPKRRGVYTTPLLNLGELHCLDEEEMVKIVYRWYITGNVCDLPHVREKVIFPKIVSYAKHVITQREGDLASRFSDSDFERLAVLLIRSTTTFNKKCDWWGDELRKQKYLEGWFTHP